MNILEFIGRTCLSLGLSALVSIMLSVLWVVLWSYVVDYFEWNYDGNTYWVLKSALGIMWITWILSFAYFMILFK